MFKIVVIVILLAVVIGQNNSGATENKSHSFPPGFLFGASSSALQIEGAWNEDGKGESGYDWFSHHVPGVIKDNSNADVADDSYHLFKTDIPFIPMAGMNSYRFSLSWPRLLPTGSPNNVNKKAVDYYNNVINEVLSYNLTPVVTIYHWDLPLDLTKLGGWANDYVIDAFVSYAEFVLKTFGDRVKYWITINEPNNECVGGYGFAMLAPGLNESGIADYLCGHYKLLAHAQVYRMFKRMPSNIQEGAMMGYAISYTTFYPWSTLNPTDWVAADLASDFENEWFINPVFGTGDYSASMRKIIDMRSLQEGRKQSRLPKFTPDQILLIKGSSDFLGINHYSAQFSSFGNHCPDFSERMFFPDNGVSSCYKPGYTLTYGNFSQLVPGCFKDALTHVRRKYNNPPVFITENGYPDGENENLISNPGRQSFFQGAISEVLESIADGSNILGYLIWGLLDDFEWNSGYTLRFGMVHVDFANVNKIRTAKPIVKFFKNFSEYGLNLTADT